MAHSTRKRRKPAGRPEKPYSEFPLYAHPLGYWSAKVDNRLYHFGRWGKRVGGELEALPYKSSWKEALKTYKARIDDVQAGLVRETVVLETPNSDDRLTVADLCNKFLTSKLRKISANELSPRSLQEYKQTTDRLIAQFGKRRLVEHLVASDFERLRIEIAKRCGPVRLGNEITRIKSVFKYAFANDLIDRPARFGSEFKKPDKAVMRRHKAESDKRLFDAAEVRLLLDALDGKEVTIAASAKNETQVKIKLNRNLRLRAAVLLGINSGAGNTDISGLRLKHLDLTGHWLNYARSKTGIDRRIPLWPDTVQAIEAAINARQVPKNSADGDCVFLTESGTRMVRISPHKDKNRVGEMTRTDYVSREFNQLLMKLSLNGRRGLGFYSLRHTLATIGLQLADRDAVRAIMGHVESDVLAAYDETGPSDARLRAVTEHVRKWLFDAEAAK